jgi:threonine 3-dehydrogenase
VKALVKERAEPGLWLLEVEVPAVGPDDVLIRVARTGICGTDLHIHAWDEWAARTVPTPLVIGHEFVGEIVEVGSGVRSHAVGEIVSGEGHIVCGRCRNCMAGRRHLCAHTRGLGVERPGAFAEFVSLPVANVWHHADGIDRDVAAIFDPFGNAVHTRDGVSRARRRRTDHVSWPDRDHGRGGRASRGRPARGRDRPDPHRLELATKVGVTRAINVREESLADVQRELGMEEGFDIGLEMSGSAEAIRDMLGQMCHGARIALLGIPPGEVAIDWNEVVFKDLTLRGVYGREMYETWYLMTAMIQSGLDISPVITDRFSATEFEEAFATAANGASGKVILDWEAM